MKKGFDFKLIAFFIVVYLIILIPTLAKAWNIQELYYDKDIRSAVVDGMFHVRDQTGYALADMRTYDIRKTSDGTFLFKYRYHYMGNIDRESYTDVDSWIRVAHDPETDSKRIVSIEAAG